MLDWDYAMEHPVESYDELKTFLTDPTNKFIFTQLAKGLGVTLLLSAGKFIVSQYGRHQLVKQGDRLVLVEKNK